MSSANPIDPIPDDWPEGIEVVALKVAPPPLPTDSSTSRATIEVMAAELGVTDLGPLAMFLDEAERESDQDDRDG